MSVLIFPSRNRLGYAIRVFGEAAGKAHKWNPGKIWRIAPATMRPPTPKLTKRLNRQILAGVLSCRALRNSWQIIVVLHVRFRQGLQAYNASEKSILIVLLLSQRWVEVDWDGDGIRQSFVGGLSKFGTERGRWRILLIMGDGELGFLNWRESGCGRFSPGVDTTTVWYIL